MFDLVDFAHNWAARKIEDRLMRRFGGIQTCTWCRQTANQGEDWSFKEWPRDPFIDVLTCGCCGGTSLWRFEIGMIYIAALDPPKPYFPDKAFYSTSGARLTPPPRSSADNRRRETMFDVIEVDIATRKVRMMGQEKNAKNAEAIERMALMRRGNGDNFFTTVPTGKYQDGDTYA